jgi:hypothetical protein
LLTEEERERIADTIVDHLRLSRWRWRREPREVGPGYMARAASADERPGEDSAPGTGAGTEG